MNTTLLKTSTPTTQLIRSYGVNVCRKKRGLPPRYAYSPLSETAEFSYLDGKGLAPLNHRQQFRYERDQYFGQQVVKYMEQFKVAKEIVKQSQQNAARYERSNSEDEDRSNPKN